MTSQTAYNLHDLMAAAKREARKRCTVVTNFTTTDWATCGKPRKLVGSGVEWPLPYLVINTVCRAGHRSESHIPLSHL